MSNQEKFIEENTCQCEVDKNGLVAKQCEYCKREDTTEEVQIREVEDQNERINNYFETTGYQIASGDRSLKN